MGEPIHLKKGEETMTVYGRHQAAVHVGEGWQLVSDIALPTPPAPVVDIDATDAAAELAKEHGIDLATVEGTGASGRILKSDVEALVNGD